MDIALGYACIQKTKYFFCDRRGSMIIGAIIFLSVNLTFLIALYMTDRTGEKSNGNMLLGVTLPYHALKDEAIINIIKKYHNTYSFLALVFLTLTIPYLLIAEYISFTLIYFLVWSIGLLYLNQRIINKYYNELFLLKREKEWWVGTRHIISIDTEVSRLKNTFAISKKWFIVPLIISAIPIITALLNKNQDAFFVPIAFGGIITLAMSFLIFLAYSKDRTATYSDNAEINIALNHVYKREWSKCWVMTATLESIFFITISFLISGMDYSSTHLILAICFSSLFTIVPIFLAHNKIRAERNRFLRLINEVMYTDDDQYWGKGAMFYYNPNDNRAMVEKRMGYGMTVNMAKAGGKATVVSIILIVVLIIWLAIFLSPLDFGSVSLSISDQTAIIHAPLSEYAFSTNDIKNIIMINDFPRAKKINGGDSAKFFVGKFSVAGYGSSNVYVHRECSPYIVIELENGWIFLNGEAKEQTQTYFDILNSGR
jgi:uncharacterized membrane protein